MTPASGTTPSRRHWAAVVIALFAGALLGFWLLADAIDQVERGEAAAGWLDDAIDLRRRRLADRDAYAQDVAATHKELAEMQQRLPDGFADAEVDAGLHALAQRHGLVLARIERGNERARDFYASRELRFELRGSDAALRAFFRDYADIVPIQRVDRLQLAPAADGGAELVAVVQAEEYRYIEDDTHR